MVLSRFCSTFYRHLISFLAGESMTSISADSGEEALENIRGGIWWQVCSEWWLNFLQIRWIWGLDLLL